MENDKMIEKTLELAHLMMEDARFLAYREAAEQNDGDAELQQLIGDFNVARMELNRLAQDKEPEAGKVETQQGRVRELYTQIMDNASMKAYSEAQNEMNALIKKINAIITGTLDGRLPEEIDLEAACSGDCSSCGGCH